MDKDLILMGQIGAAHGIKGEVRIKSFTEHPLDIGSYGVLQTDRDGVEITIQEARLAKSLVVARLKGIEDRNQAELLNGTKLYASRSLIHQTIEGEDDDYLQADLLGLLVIDAKGIEFGKVKAVQNFGGGDILEILPSKGPSVLYPFTKQAVVEVNIKDGHIVIDPPIGLFDDEP